MAHKDQWDREQNMRQNMREDGSHVLNILEVDEHSNAPFPFILVLPAADYDLSDFLAHMGSNMAGSDLDAITALSRQVAEHLAYLHTVCGCIHGDLKAKVRLSGSLQHEISACYMILCVQNIVKTGFKADGNPTWTLIDLDASCPLGVPAGRHAGLIRGSLAWLQSKWYFFFPVQVKR